MLGKPGKKTHLQGYIFRHKLFTEDRRQNTGKPAKNNTYKDIYLDINCSQKTGMVSELKDQDNYLRNAILTVDHSQEALRLFLKTHLENNNQTFDEFLNQHQHEIYHLYYDAKCCRCGPGFFQKKKKILNPSQMELLFDKNRQLPVHKSTRHSDFCCSYAKTSVTTEVLDLLLARCLLVNCCIDLFWFSCLDFKGVTFEQFLNANKHILFHLWKGREKCCMCQPDFVLPDNDCPITENDWKNMFCSTLKPCNNDRNNPEKRSNSICSFTVIPNISVQQIHTDLQNIILQYCCSTRKSVEKLAKIRNETFGHVKKASMSCSKFNTIIIEAEDAILDITDVCGEELRFKQMLLDLRDKPLDARMFCQYEKVLLQTISNCQVMSEERKIFQKDITKVISDMNDNLRVIIEDTQTTNKENHSELFREQHEIVHTTTRSNKFKDCSLRAASELLPLITSLPSGFSVFVTSAKLLQKVFDKERVKKELQDFVVEKTDKEVSKYCAGLIKLYVQYIVYLQGVGITVMSSKELETVKMTVKPLKVVERMIRIWEEIDAIKKDNVKRRNFELLMKFSKAYVYLSFLRDFIFVIFCRILEVNSEVNAMNGFRSVLENQQSQDLKLLDFFVEPSNETVTFFCMYNPSKWPVVEMLLNDYFFPNRIKQFEQTEQFLCEGNFIIKSKKFNGPLYFADIACTWFRWSDKENEQSAVNFKKCERNGKTYFQICSKKWPEYVANIGKTEWWVRGMPCSNPCDSGLWEIVHTKDDLYVLSPINSRALYMTTDRFKRVYGNRCTVSEYELFIIESVSD